MQIMLICVGILYCIWGDTWFDGVFIFIIIALMILLEVQNEGRAKKALVDLSKNVPKFCRVLRQTKIQQIENIDLVVGDIVFLEPGQVLPADLRLLESTSMEVNESILTVISFIFKGKKKKQKPFLTRENLFLFKKMLQWFYQMTLV